MIRFLIFPFSFLYSGVMSVRNWCFQKNIFRSQSFDVFTINVGNLRVGGTGKTPLVEYLINLLSTTYSIAVLSRGYGRKTKGLVQADANATAETIGDEPFQYFSKYGKKVQVVVAEKRVLGMNYLIQKFKNLEIVLLDDAYQHRAVKPQLNLLLTDFHRLFYKDFVLPAGRLREARTGAKRADAVIVTKCPSELNKTQKIAIQQEINKYTRTNIPVFFSKIKYSSILGYQSQAFKDNAPIYLISAIGFPTVFEEYLRERYEVVDHAIFPDHHAFQRAELNAILEKINKKENTLIVSTEKDMVKIKPLLTEAELKYFYYLPITVDFEEKTSFDEFILTNFKTWKSKELR